MLFMKKFAKCSAPIRISASGFVARIDSPSRYISACSASLTAGSARWARPVMPGAWLQMPAKTRLMQRSYESARDSADDLVGCQQQRLGHRQAERLRRLQVDHQLEFGRLFERRHSRL